MDILSRSTKRLSNLFAPPKHNFQVVSDLHLDHCSQYLTFHIPSAASILILGGNIGRLIDYDSYLSFLVRRCNLHEKVYLVLGALEFHGLGWMDGLQLAHKMEKEPATKGRLEVLYETRADLEGTNVTILGCTLWSHIPDNDVAAVMKKMPEFDAEGGIQGWDVQKHNSEHKRDVRWLRGELEKLAKENEGKKEERRIMVVSAFAPDARDTLEPWQVDAPWTSAYGTNLLDGQHYSSVKVWVSGSTGRTCEFEKGNTVVVSNQRGREGEHVTGLLKDGMSEKQKVGLFDVMHIVKI